MIIVDTNVISELMRAVPEPKVLRWFEENDGGDLFLTAINEAELRTGAGILAAGKRRDQLVIAIDAMIDEDFAGRVLPFDSPAARLYAEIAVARRSAGRPISDADCQIAAITRMWNAALATRNIRDFEGCGIVLVNPWDMP